MPFSEHVKSIVRKKAAFRCCRCQQVGVEIHHIIPEKEDGKEDVDNAEPLCAKCHADFGDNPTKRKELHEMRDWWYEKAATMFKLVPDYALMFEKINISISEIQQQHDTKIDDLKTALTDLVTKNYEDVMKTIASITPSSSAADATTIINTITMKASLPCLQASGHSEQSSPNIMVSESGNIPFADEEKNQASETSKDVSEE